MTEKDIGQTLEYPFVICFGSTRIAIQFEKRLPKQKTVSLLEANEMDILE